MLIAVAPPLTASGFLRSVLPVLTRCANGWRRFPAGVRFCFPRLYRVKKKADRVMKETPDGTRTAAVLTISDSCSRGGKKDLSGPAVAEALKGRGFQVVERGM